MIVCISTEIFSEYIEVLNREKFLRYPEFVAKADIVTSKLYDLAIKLTPSFKLNIVNDQSDNKFIELAVFATADFLITGNIHHFKMGEYENVKIVTPEVFVRQFKEL
jgi:putative PIN family toxin of toxin-antitoxin system